MPQSINTAIIPVAGLGTRLLPVTRAVPKEMLPVACRPVLQYAIEEAFAAGISYIVLVTGHGKQAIEAYFDRAPALEHMLHEDGKHDTLAALRRACPPPGALGFVRQQRPLGLGHAVWCARRAVGGGPFALLLPDMMMKGTPGCLAAMVEVYDKTGGNIISVEPAAHDELHNYGVVELGHIPENWAHIRESRSRAKAGPRCVPQPSRIISMVEKPAAGTAPSCYIMNGRYILDGAIFDCLERQNAGVSGEIQLTDAMAALCADAPFHAVPWGGETFDCGTQAGMLEAALSLAMDDPALAARLRPVLAKYAGT